tara:strand:+ start:246 stop:350 length:105 start_codon:yes stop_codon:yes gene_type:complete
MSNFFADWMTGIPMIIAIVVLVTLIVVELKKGRR